MNLTTGLSLVGFFVFLPTNMIPLIIAGADLIMRRLIIAVATVAKAIKSWRVLLRARKTPS
jgi:hypothetical protein